MSSSPGAWPAGVDRWVLDEVDSTNAVALRRAAEIVGPTWILGLRQTQGRGRQGRPWSDPEGNFAATLALPSGLPPAEAALRSFVAALAVSDALDALTAAGDRLTLKWPNDVLLDGGKVSGIPLEGGAILAIGIGVNLTAAPLASSLPSGVAAPVSVLQTTGIGIGPALFLDHLAPAYDRRERQLRESGFAAIRRAFLARAARLGEPIVARTAAFSRAGIFETIGEDGTLVLGTPDGKVRIAAGDVFF